MRLSSCLTRVVKWTGLIFHIQLSPSLDKFCKGSPGLALQRTVSKKSVNFEQWSRYEPLTWLSNHMQRLSYHRAKKRFVVYLTENLFTFSPYSQLDSYQEICACTGHMASDIFNCKCPTVVSHANGCWLHCLLVYSDLCKVQSPWLC